jgi:TusA-related sulfurtransferase
LTKAGVLKWTNIQRNETESLPALSQNSKLDEIAMERLNDMFEKQYFEHISPSGLGASDIAKKIGYEFISIGENIALGNFKDDQAIVQAWMDSPGHRANILNKSYAEIGIAVKKGIYENHETWIGAQIFARPLSACPAPNQEIKNEIEKTQNQITILEDKATAMRKDLERINPRNKKDIEAYNQKVDEYNALIKEINNLIKEQKNLISEYNNQVDSQNECIQK